MCVLTADSPDGLIGHVSDVLDGEGLEAVLLQEVVGAQSQQLQHDAHVTVMVEPVQHPHARAAGTRHVELTLSRDTAVTAGAREGGTTLSRDVTQL